MRLADPVIVHESEHIVQCLVTDEVSCGWLDLSDATQLPTQAALLQQLSGAVTAFYKDMAARGHKDRVLLMTFSEFGRRAHENGSRGTDHGAASCLFVAGPSVRGGVVGGHPSLADLDAGDLKFHTDFRRVYATLLDVWLGCDSKAVLGAKWDHVQALEPRV